MDDGEVAEVAEELKILAKVRHRHALRGPELVELVTKLPRLTAAISVPVDGVREQIDMIRVLVVDAVEQLAYRARVGDGDIADVEVGQLQVLLGQARETSRLIWGERQAIAAKMSGVSTETFRHGRQGDLFHTLALQLLDERRILQARPEELGTDGVAVFDDQVTLEKWLIPNILAERPQSAHIVLLSSSSIQATLRVLREVHSRVELLLCHPTSAVTPWQAQHIKRSLQAMRSMGLDSYSRLSVRFYRMPASIRAWRIGEYVGLSWYTYKDDLRLEADDPAQRAAFGHGNIIIVGDRRTSSGRSLHAWFDREFRLLRGHRLTGPDNDLYP